MINFQYTKPNIFYSAYLKNKVQFNDVDPDKVIQTTPSAPLVEQEEIKHETKSDETKEPEEAMV